MNPERSATPAASAAPKPNRRRFLSQTAFGIGALSLVPAHLVRTAHSPAPSQRPTLAGVGVGGVGFGQLQSCEQAGFEIVALCDVDQVFAKKAFDRWPKARRYVDYREMFESERDLDATYIGTPDHTHAAITMEALRRRQHVCCVKPLTRTLHECRTVVQAAQAAGVATQVTAAANTSETACRTAELIQGGVLGAVREVHVWSNRPVWPQGMTRPPGRDPIPTTLDWDRWLGPAPLRPFKGNWPQGHYARRQIKVNADWIAGYVGVYHPFNFRGWWDFGTGALGDMGCHHFNAMYRALKLTHPQRVSASATRDFEESAPLSSIVTYDFPARETMPPVRVVWYDGGLQPPPPAELGNEPLPEEGNLYVGDNAKLLAAGGRLRLLPESKQSQLDTLPRTLERRGGTWQEWIEACRGGDPAGCHFDWAELLTEAVLLGNIAIRTEKPIEWDATKLHITNVPEANRFIQEPYRDGWHL